MGLADEIAARTGPGLDLVMGVVTEVSADNGRVTVNVGGNPVPNVLFVGGYSPNTGDGVALLRSGQLVIGIGGTGLPLQSVGTVASVPLGSATILVTVAGTTYSLPFVTSYSPVVADRVYLLWPGTSRAGIVLGKVGVTAAPPPPPPPPGPPPGGSGSGVATFVPTHDGTWRSGWREDANGNVIQGTAPTYGGANEGAWFYSGQISGTLSGATVTDFQIFLARTEGGVFGTQSLHLYRVTDNARPAGALTFGSGPHDLGISIGEEAWFGLPTSLAQELVDSGGSIGIKGSPYMRMKGLLNTGQAGALRISWRR